VMCNARKWEIKGKVEWGGENEISLALSSRLGHKSTQESLNYVYVCFATVSFSSPSYILLYSNESFESCINHGRKGH
jgi:hypothetical protein